MLPVPLVAAFNLQEFVAQAGLRNPLAVGIDQDHVERGVIALTKRATVEQRPHADHLARGRHRQRQLALHGASAGLGQPNRDAGFQQALRAGQLVERNFKRRLAVFIRGRKVSQRLLLGIDPLAGAELITGEARPLLRGTDKNFTLDLEICCRRAVEEAPVQCHLGRGIRRYLAGRRSQFEFKTVRHIIFHHEGGLADRGPLRVGERFHTPGAARRGLGNRHRQRTAALPFILEHACGGIRRRPGARPPA